MKQNHSKQIINYFDSLYKNPKCMLNYNNNFELLVAVVLSAQTTDKKVNSITKGLFKKYNTPLKLSKAKQKDVEKILKPLGLANTKSKSIISLSKDLVSKFNSKVPNNKKDLMTFRKLGSKLQGHPSSVLLDGVEISTGSLGQGLSIACGMALGLKLDKINSFVYAYLGDGEIQEGQIYEAMMNAGHNRLDNLIAIIDRNGYQIDGHTECVKAVNPIDKKFQSFGWQTLEVAGHDIEKILEVYEKAKELAVQNKKPVAIIANTVKGKGVSFMENTSEWHGKAPNTEQFEAALKELEGAN